VADHLDLTRDSRFQRTAGVIQLWQHVIGHARSRCSTSRSDLAAGDAEAKAGPLIPHWFAAVTST
jgi:hypothetical protein